MKSLIYLMSFFLLVSFSNFSYSMDESKIKESFPFFPSLLTTKTGQTVHSSNFESPSVCMGCHPDIYNQWKGSMHSNAFRDPVFQALWNLAEKEAGPEMRNLCGGCHTAVGTVAQEVKKENGKFIASETAMEGVSCDLCHTIVDTRMKISPTGLPQNASFVVEPGDVKRGPYKDSVSTYHKSEYSELHTKSEFCGSCHNVFHPVSNFHIENTYTEWKFSVYAQKGIQCQDCHMVPVEVAVQTAKTLKKPEKLPGRPSNVGPIRDYMYTHEFVGGNAVITKLMGSDKHSEIAIKRLQNAASLDVKFNGGKKGELSEITVKVKNETAGHNLPTSLTEVREMWLEVTVTDDNGKIIYKSGGLDKDGNVDPTAEMFNAYAVDEQGHHTVKPWEIARFEYNNTIPPKGSKTVKYIILTPKNAKNLKIDVKLNYRSYPQAVANLLLGPNAPKIPTILMTSKNLNISLK